MMPEETFPAEPDKNEADARIFRTEDRQLPDFVIREAEERDLAKLHEIEVSCFSDPWSPGLIRECLENSALYRVYAAEDENGILGYSVMSLVADQAGVDNLAVLPAFRRRGIGAALLSKMISEARIHDMAWVFLEVRESNESAIALYERSGFQKVGFRKHYYENPEEGAVLYTLTLYETE